MLGSSVVLPIIGAAGPRKEGVLVTGLRKPIAERLCADGGA